MVRFGPILGIVFGLLSLSAVPAAASSLRFEFNLLPLSIGYQDLINLETGQVATRREARRFARKYHSLSDYRNSEGHVVVEFSIDEHGSAALTSCSATGFDSDFLCESNSFFKFVSANGSGFDLYGPEGWSLRQKKSNPRRGKLNYIDDANFSGREFMNGSEYFWMAPIADAKVRRLKITELSEGARVAAVPLPSSYMLFAPLLLLPLIGRRKRG